MKLDLGKIFFLILFLTLSVMAATAGTIKGTITDRQTKEPLTGATVQVSGTAQGAVADLDGNYTLELKNGTYTLTVRYIGYKDMTINAVEIKGETVLNFDMEPDTQTLGEVQVTAKKNLEGERALQMERQKATLAIENLGSKEMHRQCGRRSKENNGHLHRQRRTTYRPRTRRPLQHHHAERTAHRLAQPGQQAGAARPVPLVHRTEHHRQQGV